MKRTIFLAASALLLTALLDTGCVVVPARPGIPAPVVEAEVPIPFPGAIWVPGAWDWHDVHSRWEWHHGHY